MSEILDILRTNTSYHRAMMGNRETKIEYLLTRAAIAFVITATITLIASICDVVWGIALLDMVIIPSLMAITMFLTGCILLGILLLVLLS